MAMGSSGAQAHARAAAAEASRSLPATSAEAETGFEVGAQDQQEDLCATGAEAPKGHPGRIQMGIE
eukprot:2437355-Pyramimonas_sp.AAC.1